MKYGFGRTAVQMACTLLALCLGIGLLRQERMRTGFSEERVTLPIIMYHSILKDDARQGKYVVSPEVLARDLDAYLAGHIVYSECSAPSARERETERVMLALRTTRGVAADTLPEAARRILRNYEAHGLAHLSGGFYALTPRGFLVSNAILVDLLETMEL